VPNEQASERSATARRIEIVATVLLALATVATAWSSYQSARWSGVQASSYGRAAAARVESTRASTQAGQLLDLDVALFTEWLDAFAGGQERLARFYEERFRDEFAPAFAAWRATNPTTNPDAPKSPFAMPEYKLASSTHSDQLLAEAEAATAEAQEANQRSDNYVLCVVFFASALFFAGMSTSTFRSERVRLGLLVTAALVFVGAAAWIATFPVSFGI